MDEEFESEDFEDEEADIEPLDDEELDEDAVDLEEDIDDEADDAEAVDEEEEELVLLEEEDVDSDEVEATLDKILEERVGVRAGLDEDDDEEFDEGGGIDDRGAAIGVAPKRPGEFTCRSCFLVKHPSQLADEARMLCRDCV